MGHERTPHLPKTKTWRNIVQQIAGFDADADDVEHIVRLTTDNVRSRFDGIQRDDGVKAAFEFLLALAVTSREENPNDALSQLGIHLPEAPTPLSFAKAISSWIAPRTGSLEYARIAQSAAIDTVATWIKNDQSGQEKLFAVVENPSDVWRKAGNGTGFCELSRLFFANFTGRYLNYFLEREASAVLDTAQKRDEFGDQVRQHVEEVSQHAFETAKITQSFAAGWFTNHAAHDIPSPESIEKFLSLAFKKVREELRREGER